MRNKQNGFERLSPQTPAEPTNDNKEFPCSKCDYKLESEGLLAAHMQKHSEHEPAFECTDCGKEFSRSMQLDKHVRTYHKTEEKKSKEYNCEDCPFQGENGLELKKHVQRTKHCPSETKEECYTCKKEFPNYWQLMNHRKEEHPSNKICRYFKEDACQFTDVMCWYKHESKLAHKSQENLNLEYPCNICDEMFGTKSDLMRHKKHEHRQNIAKCRDFMQGKCAWNSSSCWFLHDDQEMEMEIDDEQDFHKAQEKNPPDQISMMMKMIQKLSLQIEILEKKAMQNL